MIFRVDETGSAATDFERALAKIPRLGDALPIDQPDHNIDRMFLETLQPAKSPYRGELAIYEEGIEPVPLSPTRDVCMETFARFYQRRQDL